MTYNRKSERLTGKSPVERLLAAIGYPERMSGDGVSSVLLVDGMEIRAEEMDGRVVLSYVLTEDGGILPTLAGYAASRILREEAALTWEAARGSAILWQDVAANSDALAFTRLFETFMNSCDWWRARVDALRGEGQPVPEPMMIRP